MDIKALKRKLIERLDNDPELGKLGTRDKLLAYLKEEFKELDLSNCWGEIVFEELEPRKSNPNNILVYYLAGTHEMPARLQHKYSGGDFPDIDMDFEPDQRERIKEYLRKKFGEYNCMEVSTFTGMHVKTAIQDLARIEGIDPQEVFKVTTTIDYNVNNEEENRLDYIIEHNPAVDAFLKAHPKIHAWVEKMQDVKRAIGKHASAFVISSKPITEYIPVILGKNKELLTGYPESSVVKSLNEMGLIKFDILGLENLTVIRDTLELIRQRHGVEIDFEKIDLNDPEVYRLVRRGYNGGVFQIDSALAGMVISTIQPTNFEDLSALNALIRPACLQVKSHEYYRDHKLGKFDRSKFPVWLDLKGKISDFTFNLLNATYGIPIYQEQTMAMLAEFCGVNLDETNKMRKIIGKPANKRSKEDFEYIEENKKRWMKYGGERFGLELAAQWWDTAVGSLSYGFNRSHSIAYALIAYRQLYLKAKYPQEFYTALLRTVNAEANSAAKLMKFVVEAKALGVDIEPPHINYSKQWLDEHNGKIYIGFSQIKGIGEVASKDIVERGPYSSFEDFIAKHTDAKYGKSGVNKTAIEALIYTNAFRDFDTRQNLLYKYWHSKLSKREQANPWHLIPIPGHFEILKRERDCITIVLSEKNPLKLPYGYIPITKAIDTPKERVCKIMGIVEDITWHTSKTGKKYAKLIINDFENSASILCWSNTHKAIKTLKEGCVVSVTVKHLDNETFSLVNINDVEVHND